MESTLVTVKAHSHHASLRTKNRAGCPEWSVLRLERISRPDCMGGRLCGLFKTIQGVEQGQSCSGWFGWLPLDELIIKKDGKFLDFDLTS